MRPVRIKALAPVIIIGFIVALTYHFIALAAIDAPHNNANSVGCGSCHGEGLLQSFWGGSGLYSTVDQLCLSCHTASSGPYTDTSSPLVKTHSSVNTSEQYGTWSRECLNCHDPHYQKQKNYKNSDASELYLASGIITNYHYDPPPPSPPGEPEGVGTSTLTYSDAAGEEITYKSGWDATKLLGKTIEYRSAILFPNIKKLGFSYPIIGIDEGARTITVKGDIRPVYEYITTSSFAVMYGQFIKDAINSLEVMDINTGTGADGPIAINSVKNINTDTIAGGRSYADGVNWQITDSVPSGQTTISSGIARPYGFAVGDEIIIINLKGTPADYSGVGRYEFKIIEDLPDSYSITVASDLNTSYDGTTQKVMVQRVPQYTDVSINTGGSLTGDAFDGNKGGVITFRASGTVAVNAVNGISAYGQGYRGGLGHGVSQIAEGGETYNGTGGAGGQSGGNGNIGQGGGGGGGSTWPSPAGIGAAGTEGAGGGGGGIANSPPGWAFGGGGGGGGYASAGGGGSGYTNGSPGDGTNGGSGGNGNGGSNRAGGGGGGGNYGISDLSSRLWLGSGGGAGGGAFGWQSTSSCIGGSGGNGGGIVYISADTINVSSGGSIKSNGRNGSDADNGGGCGGYFAQASGGGGGAGGSIAILSVQFNNSGAIDGSAGSGGGGGYAGGSGGSGRTFALYESFSGNLPSPSYLGKMIATPGSSTAFQVKFFDNTGTNSFADGATSNSICEICHGITNHFRNTGGAPDQNHTNLGSDIPGTNCIACHSHVGGFSALSGGCLGCHSTSLGGRAAITEQFSTNSHHIQEVTITDSHCYQCHWEANYDGSLNATYHEGWNPATQGFISGAKVDLVIYGAGTRPATYTVGTTAVQYMANGTRSEIKEINSHCLGCHSSANNNTLPFGDGKTPKQYAWDSRSIGERYSQTGTTPWGKYSGGNFTPKNTRTKAYSAHGNPTNNQGGWNLSETWPNTRAGSENVACFDCHNSHGSNVNGRTTSYDDDDSTTTNHGILKDTLAGQGGYSIAYKPQAGGSTPNKNIYNAGAGLCFDCHLTATSGTTLWGYNGTFGATQAISGYRDTPYFGPATANPQQRFSYKLSNAIKGGHFGASSALNGMPSGTINGLCTPCHDPHGVSPTLGANMQYGVPLLKGTWLTSPYKEDWAPAQDVIGTIRSDRGREGIHYYIDQNTFGSDIKSSVTGITQTDSQFAGLCLNCHSKNSLTDGTTHTWKSKDRIHESVKGWKTANTTIQHNYPCSKCHIPHNAGLPRLMITNCLEARHKGFKVNNTAPLLEASGSGYNDQSTNDVFCGTQTCGDLPGGGGAKCSEKLGFCPPYYYTYGCSIGGNGKGSGRWPGHWLGGCYSNYYGWGSFVSNHTVTCHENHDGNQHWNVKTPWASTNPFTPSLIDEPNLVGTVPLSVTLEWNSVTSPCYGPVEYSVQVDEDVNFGSPVTSSWLSGNNWTVPITTEGTWHWRVQARDAVDTDVISEWSIADSFIVSQTPTAPLLVPQPDIPPTPYKLTWYAVTGPGGDPVQYYVEMSWYSDFHSDIWWDHVASGWISGTSWSVTPNPIAPIWYWRVRARNANHTTAVSPWSTVDSFVGDYAGD